MADLAESVDDLICIFEGNPDLTMDTLAMFIFGWILVALFILWLGKFIYARFILKEDKLASEAAKVTAVAPVPAKIITNGDVTDAKVVDDPAGDKIVKKVVSAGVKSGYVPPTPPTRKRLSRKSPVPDLKKVQYTPAPQATGPDNVSVLWVNDVFQWLYNDLVIVNEILNVWIQCLNEFNTQSVTEVSSIYILFQLASSLYL